MNDELVNKIAMASKKACQDTYTSTFNGDADLVHLNIAKAVIELINGDASARKDDGTNAFTRDAKDGVITSPSQVSDTSEKHLLGVLLEAFGSQDFMWVDVIRVLRPYLKPTKPSVDDFIDTVQTCQCWDCKQIRKNNGVEKPYVD